MENDHIKHILEQLESGQLTASDAYDQLKLAVLDTKNKVKDKANAVKENILDILFDSVCLVFHFIFRI